MLLGPGTPMLFQGQEFASSSPFLYFADHNPELARFVAEGRTKFLSQFPSIASPGAADLLADPELEETFTRCKLDFSDREKNRHVYEMHRDLLRLRKEDPLLGSRRRDHSMALCLDLRVSFSATSARSRTTGCSS
jgi:maltooligosyltrehalose trehalohydrolase